MSFKDLSRKGVMRNALNLFVAFVFVVTNLGIGYAMPATHQVSMLRQSAANNRIDTTVAAMGVELLKATFDEGGAKHLKAVVSDKATDKVEDQLEQGFIKDGIAVLERDGKTYLIKLIGLGGRLDVSGSATEFLPFASEQERDDFISGGQLTWIAGDYTPAELIRAQGGAKQYLQSAGRENRIFVEEDLPGQVAKYSKADAEAQAALVARLQAAFDFHRGAIDGITQEDVSAMALIGLAPGFPIAVGAEDFSVEGGPAVGRITIDHLKEIGLKDTVIGHSATRSHIIDYEKMSDGTLLWGHGTRASAGDRKEDVTKKLRQALEAGMKVSYCIGEDLFMRQQGEAVSDVLGQLDDELGSLNLTGEQVLGLLEAVAYEPLWAIGTGVRAESEQIQEMHAAIRQWFADRYGKEVAAKLVIEYGGSVNTNNAAEIFALPDVDGALIGGASLESASFVEIASIAEEAGRQKGKAMHVSANWKAEDVSKRDPLLAHLAALASKNLGNTSIRYYLPFTMLAQAKNMVEEAISQNVEAVREDIGRVRQAIVLDEADNPSFYYEGEVGSSRFVAATASSGGYLFEGYDFGAAGGRAPRSTYNNLAMIESYLEMAKTDPEARRAYKLKSILHEYLDVSGRVETMSLMPQEIIDLINRYDEQALAMWKAREAEKARVRILEEENRKTIAEATTANLRNFVKVAADFELLIDVANTELDKLVAAGLLTDYRVVVEDNGRRFIIFTTRKNSNAIEDDAKVPAAILGVYLEVLNRAKARGFLLAKAKDLTGRSYGQIAEALEIKAPLPTLKYLETEGWVESIFGSNVKTALVEPEDQPKGFFTNVYHSFRIAELFRAPVEQIPNEVVNAVRSKLNREIDRKIILGALVMDFEGKDIDVQITHRYGKLNATEHRIILEAIREGCLEAQRIGLLREGIDISTMSLAELARSLRTKPAEHSITERGSEPVVMVKLIGAGIGAANIKLYHEFFITGSTPQQKLGFTPKGGVRGFRAIVRRTNDVLNGNFDGDVWEFEKSAAATVNGVYYPSVDQSLELLAKVGQPNDFIITEIYTVEGSKLSSTEPLVTVVYQPVYGEQGDLRTLNPTFICRSQSGADAVGGVASMFYDVNSVPGGPEGKHYVFTKPATLEEARRTPPEGIAYVVVYGWQSKQSGVIPREEGTIVDHVAINPLAFTPEKELADFLASVMITHEFDQPYLAPFAVQAMVEPLRNEQSHLFVKAPKEAEIDPVMDAVEAKVASGEFLSVTDDKADMGGIFGHNFTPSYMLAIDLATMMQAVEDGALTDGNIIGFVEKKRLGRQMRIKTVVEAIVDAIEGGALSDPRRTIMAFIRENKLSEVSESVANEMLLRGMDEGKIPDSLLDFMEQHRLAQYKILDHTRLATPTYDIGDDSHIVALGDRSRNSAETHQLSFLAFTRGYLGSVIGNDPAFDPESPVDFKEQVRLLAEKPYGRGQDFAGKEAKAAMANPYFYSRFNKRFFEILREVMPFDYMQMVDNLEIGWRHWQETQEATTELVKSFSGNVSNQGIGTARYLVDIAGGERAFGILAGDKMGPAALNRVLRGAVYSALDAGEFENGLVFEIWDAKALDDHGNIPIDELPTSFSDIEESVNELNEASEQDFVRNSYGEDGLLKNNLSRADKERLAALLKKAGYVPSKRIFLDAQADKDAIFLYLADSDRFNIKQIWTKNQSGWNIENPTAYLLKPTLGSSVTKLGILAGGEYIGKDDPVMVGHMKLMKHVYAFLKDKPLIIQGDMNGSHWLAAIPTSAKYAVANKESHPILVGLIYTLSEDGTKLASVEDVFGSEEYNAFRAKMFKFDHAFKIAQLGGQFEPYGTNWRTVEAAYPLAKFLRALDEPNSPFLIRNMDPAKRALRPIGMYGEAVDVFNVATASLEVPSAPKGYDGTTEWAQRFYPALLQIQSQGVSHKLSDDVITVARDAANRKVILINSSVLRNDPSLILALQSINRQINQNLGVFDSAENVEANAYQFVLVADDVALRTETDVDRFFSEIARATNNRVTVNKGIFAKILTQDEMLEGRIGNTIDLLKQLKRMGITSESIVAVVGPNAWITNMTSAFDADAAATTGKGWSAEEPISKTKAMVSVDAQDGKAAFAANALFAAMETVAAPELQLPDALKEELDVALLSSGAMEVRQEDVKEQVGQDIAAYRAAVSKI